MKSAKPTSNFNADRPTHMSDGAFADLKKALEDALAFERGERRELRITRIEGCYTPKVSVKKQRSEKR
jgi:hypothetical protein